MIVEEREFKFTLPQAGSTLALKNEIFLSLRAPHSQQQLSLEGALLEDTAKIPSSDLRGCKHVLQVKFMVSAGEIDFTDLTRGIAKDPFTSDWEVRDAQHPTPSPRSRALVRFFAAPFQWRDVLGESPQSRLWRTLPEIVLALDGDSANANRIYNRENRLFVCACCKILLFIL